MQNMPIVHVFSTRIAIYLIVSALLLVVTGCASTRLIESQVTAFSTLPAATTATSPATAGRPAPATYRFERLPSQQADAQRRDQQEALAQAALDKQGLQRVGDAPGAPGSPVARYSVQMTLSMQRADGLAWDGWGTPLAGPYAAPWGWGGAFISIGVGSHGHRHGGGFASWSPYPYGYFSQAYFVRDVSLVMRDVANNQVVYETRARHEGRWADSAAVLPAMLEAALRGFPTPPAGTRRVVVEIGAENSVIEDKNL